MERLDFSTEESEKIEKYKESLSLDSPESISIFGTALQQKMANLSDRLLKNTAKQDIDHANELIEKINNAIGESSGRSQRDFSGKRKANRA